MRALLALKEAKRAKVYKHLYIVQCTYMYTFPCRRSPSWVGLPLARARSAVPAETAEHACEPEVDGPSQCAAHLQCLDADNARCQLFKVWPEF